MSLQVDNNDLSDFECPVCMEFFRLPIYQCANGHSFCYDCTSRMSKCPQCQRKITESRNYVLENLIQRVQFKCPLCTISLKLSEYADHSETCTFGDVNCIAPNCNEVLTNGTILSHIRSKHASFLVQDQSILKSHQMTISCVDIGHNIFWLERHINDDNFMFWFAQPAIALGSQVSYQFTVTAILRDGARHSISFPCYNSIIAEDFMITNAVVAFQKSRTQGAKFEVTLSKN